MNTKLHASFTIEASYIFTLIFLAISAMIRFSWMQRNACLAAFVLSDAAESASHCELRYDPNGPTPEHISSEIQRRFSSVGALADSDITVTRSAFRAKAAAENTSMQLLIENSVVEPESVMRASTALLNFTQNIHSEKGEIPNAADSE